MPTTGSVFSNAVTSSQAPPPIESGSIVASLTPVGLAFKVPDDVRQTLLQSGRATQLRYFPNAPIKKDYVLFDSQEALSASNAALLILGRSPTEE